MPPDIDIPFIFLGLAQRASHHDHGVDVIGLSHVALLPFFPVSLAGTQCVIGLKKTFISQVMTRPSTTTYELLLTDAHKPENQAWSSQSFCVADASDRMQREAGSDHLAVGAHEMFRMRLSLSAGVEPADEACSYQPLCMPTPPLTVSMPGLVYVDVSVGGSRCRLGTLRTVFAPQSPLSEEERAAIASRPDAANAVCLEIKCNVCGEVFRTYAMLDPKTKTPDDFQQLTPITGAPAKLKCKCADNEIDLKYLKEGIHSVFRQPMTDLQSGGIMAKPLYEIAEIRQIRSAYAELIASEPKEEDVQSFMHAHPLLWHFLAPTKILPKPPLLTKYKADFGILTTQGILYFVEIEKPQSRLVGTKGKLHGEIQTAFEQIRDWSVVVEDHRLAVLDSLGLRPEEVHDIRYIVVAGLAGKTPRSGLTKLQRNLPTAGTHFYCFDEIESYLRALEAQLVSS